jgi:hypothetical protein
MTIALEATALRECWIVRPVGTLGTCGWIAGRGWSAIRVPFRGPFGRHIDATKAVQMAGKYFAGLDLRAE